jgi:plastocyanin
MKRLFLALGLVVLAALTAACSPTAAQPPASAGPVDPNAPVIVAQGNAFSPSTLDVTADKAFSLTLDNKDSAPHNVAIYTDSIADLTARFGRRPAPESSNA